MRATTFHGAGDIRVEDVADSQILAPTDAIVRVTKAGICGSDLHFLHFGEALGMTPGLRLGHEFVGVVEEVGPEATGISVGDRVVAPFAFSDGSCTCCSLGVQTSCTSGGIFGSPFWGESAGGQVEGGQAEYVRVPQAGGTLVVIPESLAAAEHDTKVLPLGDVMSTGYHAAVNAGVGPGSTAVVIGDGAVGLSGVISAKLLGAERIIHVGHHADRLELGSAAGATHSINGKEQDVVATVMELTGGLGADGAVETISSNGTIEQAITVTRPGGNVGIVGMSHFFEEASGQPYAMAFMKNVSLHPGVCPSRAYIPGLLDDLQAGKMDPSIVFTHDLALDDAPEGYRIMDERVDGSIKVALTPGA